MYIPVLRSVAIALIAGFAATYTNPHEWNRELWWEGVRFTLLRCVTFDQVHLVRWPQPLSFITDFWLQHRRF